MNARVTITGTMHGNTIQNVLHFSRDGATQQDLQGLGPLIVTDWVNVIRTQQASVYRVNQIMVQQIAPVFAQALITPVSIPGNNPETQGCMSFQAVILSFKTGLPGRKGRGRVYIGGIRSDSMHLNLLNSSRLPEWQTIVNNLKARWCFGGTMPWTLSIIPRNEPTNDKSVIDIAVKTVFGVQRRRNTAVGI